ncbi:hypothetical protein D0817_00805 [Flavobacterium cupreum]|uniref:Lipoprotein n=1 Tax=Flavobacterium cupreum TaxID=2133766 RepID=A0A434ACT9_9FLAO|nr:hypothetical protein [Flavobacterium cupreum]RUT72190.1 hypothetical protein D0817_00805 [Flavobacterium cupreum]
MKKYLLTCAAILIAFTACKQNDTLTKSGESELNETTLPNTVPEENAKTAIADCKEAESLVFEAETFASYTEDRMRGKGVVSFTLEINDRLTILNEDDTTFGEMVLNEDMNYFTLTMPKKVVARKVVPNADFAAFDFDSENVNADKDYLFIYINKEKRKVKKTDLKFTFSTWEDYIKKQTLQLKDCNLLTDTQGKPNPKSKGVAFRVTEITGDEVKIKSVKDCSGEESSFRDMQGKVKLKSADVLLVDFAVCN